MLEVKNLTVEINNRIILNNLSLSIKQGEVMILFGPNGSGKSTLIKTIMGMTGYTVKAGDIIFDNINITHLPIEKRVSMGMGIMYQHPPKIVGVKLLQLAHFLSSEENIINNYAKILSTENLLHRDINFGFSGGEMKRSELFQLLLQNPSLALLDEPESGVDIENIALMGQTLNTFLRQKNKSALIITHTGYILDYIKAERGCVMIEGNFWCSGDPKEMFESIRKKGYDTCRECACPQKS